MLGFAQHRRSAKAVSSEVAWFVLVLVLVSAVFRLANALRGFPAGNTGKRLDAISAFAFGGIVALWAHRIFEPYAHRFEPGYEPGVAFAGLLLGFLAAVDVFKNALSTETQRAIAHFAVAGFVALSFVAAETRPGNNLSRSEEQMLLELAASNGPATGPPGTVPPFLELVRDDGDVTTIRNRMDQPLRIRLTRYANGYRCKMYFDGLERGDPGEAYVQAGQTQTFSGSTEPQCRAGPPLPPLEFEATLTSSPLMIWRTATLPE
jgi:hypothetical protein